MRIAHVVHNFPPEFLGGTERFVAEAARAQLAAGHEVLVVAGSDEPHRGVDLEPERWLELEVLRLKRTPEEAYHLDPQRERSSRVLRELWGRRAPEIVHVHHWQTLPFDLARGAAASGALVFVSLHDFFAVCPRFFRLPPDPGVICPSGTQRGACQRCVAREVGEPDELLEARFARRDEALRAELACAVERHAPSWTHARALAQLLPADAPSIEVVEPGLPEPFHRSALGAPRRRTVDEPLRLATWGNHVWVKGLLVLVEALAQQAVPALVELEVIGPFRDEALERAVRARAEEAGLSIRFHGAYRGLPDLQALTRDCDLAAFPSLAHESYGLVVDEALALGLPVLVSDRGALGERCGDAGVVLPAGDAEAWARALRRLSVDRAWLEELREALPGRVPTMQDAARDLLARYARALAGNRAGGTP